MAAPSPAARRLLPPQYFDFVHIPVLPKAVAGRPLQAKLTVGAPNDAFEQEADSVAERIMRMTNESPPTGEGHGAPEVIQRACTGCEEEDVVRRKVDRSEAGMHASPDAEAVISSSGSPLDADARSFMEQRFGLDFSRIRIHADSRSAASAEALHAHAYTVGNHIAFARGQYAPNSNAGRRLLAHELTHTIQQQGPGNGKIQRGFNPGRCCNESEERQDEFALVTMNDDTARWQRLSVGECVGGYLAGEDCEGMTCGGGFYYVDGWISLLAPGVCRTPRRDSWPFASRRWTPTQQGPNARSPSSRAAISDTPPGYSYDP